ncbi:hypothetical protein VMCG_10075 [Cytospora schulzeri]|uniref:Uncharacterized protein n=1 Tax=Cytospora schulzeri TaxID=448051 RepID=A0A423VCQ6_9PEZI|nr:hypothetical protein VMCG_10075 [Valsa malicola]
MSSSKKQSYKECDKPQADGSDGMDWSLVNDNDGNNDIEEDFEIIDASEVRCWCGGKDADRCRIKGHTFPLCEIERSKFRPEPRYVRSSQHEGIWVTSDSVANDTHASGNTEANESRNNGQSSTLQKPFSDEVDPVSKVMILSNLLRGINRNRKSNLEGP